MKTKSTIDLTAAFPDPKHEPDDTELRHALGAAFAPLAEVFAWVRTNSPAATSAWQYSNQAGWYRISVLKKRRLFYLVPKRDAFQLSLILGGKALESLKTGSHARAVEQLLKTAMRYPEGTAFRFDHVSCDPALIAALLKAKLAH